MHETWLVGSAHPMRYLFPNPYSLFAIPYPLNYGSQKRRLRARDRQYVGK